jgi:hypothetical protein
MSFIQYLYGAILCSVGWFVKKLTVVLVLVALRLMSVSIFPFICVVNLKIYLSVIFVCWTDCNIFVYLVHIGGDDLCAVRYNHDIIYITYTRSYVFDLEKKNVLCLCFHQIL